MIRIAIVEDCQNDKDQLYDSLISYVQKTGITFSIDTYDSGQSFLLKKCFNYDIVFMDIELGDSNGIQISLKIREQNSDVIIILITNLIQYAIQGYSISAKDFILKPIEQKNLSEKMDKWISLLNKRKKYIMITVKEHLLKLQISHISFIEVYGHKLIVHTTEDSIEIFSSLRAMELQLKEYGFEKCNRCYLVNLHHVNSITQNKIEVNGQWIELSRRKRKSFISALTRLTVG